jgi:hypothetical protein
MPRTIVDIPSAQMRLLDARCKALGISRAEGVRRAVHGFLNVKYGLDQEGFGLWAHSVAQSPGPDRSRSVQGKAP